MKWISGIDTHWHEMDGSCCEYAYRMTHKRRRGVITRILDWLGDWLL